MKEEYKSKLSPHGRKLFHLIEFDEEEELVCEIRKDPVGLAFIYLAGGLVVFLALVSLTFLSNSAGFSTFLESSQLEGLRPLIMVFGWLAAILVGILTVIYGILYRSNVIYITSEKIAQVLYQNIFNRKISQLSIGDVQDVTVVQKGILPRIFKYGTLVIETAGEQSNYTFTFIPNPYEASTEIVGAHERNLQAHGN